MKTKLNITLPFFSLSSVTRSGLKRCLQAKMWLMCQYSSELLHALCSLLRVDLKTSKNFTPECFCFCFCSFTEPVQTLGPTEGSNQASGMSTGPGCSSQPLSVVGHISTPLGEERNQGSVKRKKIRMNHVSAQLLFFFCIFPLSTDM